MFIEWLCEREREKERITKASQLKRPRESNPFCQSKENICPSRFRFSGNRAPSPPEILSPLQFVRSVMHEK